VPILVCHFDMHVHAGWLARVGSGLFLILQMVILLDFVQTWNDAWVSMEDENYIYGLLGLTVRYIRGMLRSTQVP